MFGYSKEAVRVKVKKCEGKLQPELRKFSVDPQITSLEVLQSILVKAFDIKSDFTLSYRTVDDYGQEIFLPLLSDWDLDAAFLKTHNTAVTQHSEPCVQLRVDMKPFSETSDDWEPPQVPVPIATNQNLKDQPTVIPCMIQTDKQEAQIGFQGLIMTQVEKTFNMVSRALNLYEDPNNPPRPPLSDIEFRSFLDTVGQITNSAKLREVIYCGGIEPSLRKVVWKHILNVYPDGMTGKERMDYIKRKANEYYALRAKWKDCIQKNKVNADLTYVTSMVRKDVLRTDRHHKFYAGSDDNQNIASLFNILTTYALNHPSVSYCQGMSDLASPLLVTMGDEAHAYICLCALMSRLYPNFLLDGEAMTLKFSHLAESLQVYDNEFYNYLKSQQADDLLFCYRWLLLEMKREFAFDDALRMLEVLWASLPQKNPSVELSLKEKEFDPTISVEDPPPLSPLVKAPRENAYTMVCAIRRQSSSFSIANVKAHKLTTCTQINHSLDENLSQSATTKSLLKNVKEYQSLDDTVLQLQNGTVQKKLDICKDNEVAVDSKTLNLSSVTSVSEHSKQTELQDSSWLSTGCLANGCTTADYNDTPLGSQIKLLRDKISVHNSKFFSSLDRLDGSVKMEYENRPQVKMIKNLNEFLNFATSSKPTCPVKQEKIQRAKSVMEKTSPKVCPKITFTKTSFEESDVRSYVAREHRAVNKVNKELISETTDGSSPDDSQEYYPMTTSMTRELRLESEHLDRQVFGPSYVNRCSLVYDSPSDSCSVEDRQATSEIKLDEVATDTLDTRPEAVDLIDKIKKSPVPETLKSNAKSAEDIYVWENPLHLSTPPRTASTCPHTPDEQAELDFDGDTGEILEDNSGKKSITPIRLLRKNRSFESQKQAGENAAIINDRLSDSDSLEEKQNDSVPAAATINKKDILSTSRSHKFFSSMSQELENAKKNCESLLTTKQSNLNSVALTINNFQKKYEALKPSVNKTVSVSNTVAPGDSSSKNSLNGLPPPMVFGGGNPFLMFLCLTVLLQHRDFVMRNRMDYNELAMHFDKMVRKHNVNRVLNQARQMYAMYLKQQAFKTGDITM